MQKELSNNQNGINSENIFTSPMICHLSDFGLLKVSGKDAKQLLQGQFTNNIETLTPGKASLCAHCNPQGRIISLFYIFQYHDSFYLFMPQSMIAIEMNALKKYAIFYKVEMHDLSENLMLISHTNPALTLVDEIIPFKIISHYVFAGNPSLIEPLWNQFTEQEHLASINRWKLSYLVQGIAFIYPETSEKCLPHEINLHERGGIDFNKGCYTGQEIIARMHYRAKLKNHLYLATIHHESSLHPGSPLYSLSGHEIKVSGMIVDACFDKDNNYYALIITDEANAKDNHLFLDRNQNYFKLHSLKRE